MPKKINFYPVILAGGRGTRFWPLSRKRRAKQMLALDGSKTMIQQTVDRLLPLAPRERFWIITNQDLRDGIARQLPKVPRKQIVAEPVGRNTAPAIGLAAFLLLRQDPAAVLGLFPSDHTIQNAGRFRQQVQQAVRLAVEDGYTVVMGISPTRPETGYGYIEGGEQLPGNIRRVRRFTEKPNAPTAHEFLNAGNYYWNSGMFVWSARTLTEALREYLPKTADLLEQIATAYGSRKFESTFARLYPKCENISVDYAVLEPRSARGERGANIYCLPAEFPWNDLGSWAALYEHRQEGQSGVNIIAGDKTFTLNAEGNYIHAPGKFVAAVGVKDLVVVETDDALLITTREHAQDVGKVVKYLDEKKLTKLV
ncbi:MAG: mannose-1-phosphate guanylyltransferase [Candidatus Korobacteraceae bacterium]